MVSTARVLVEAHSVKRFPTYFVSHGAPDLLFADVPAHDFLARLGQELPRPRAIVCASAHWLTRAPTVDVAEQPQTIHDFGGFAPELYEVEYAAPGAPQLAREVAELLRASGIETNEEVRGLDHGAWVPLKLMYPDASVPIVQLALQPMLGAAHHLALGRALAPLTSDGVLVLGSGSATHNLRMVGPGDRPPAWVTKFDDWLAEHAEAGDVEALVDYRARSPEAVHNHPSEEHYFPLLVALGAAGEGARGRTLHASFTYEVLSMHAFAFEAVRAT